MRSAISLIEVLVCFAILAILLALLLPTVQRIRESANRIRCANNLNQMGRAFQSYQDIYRRIPDGGEVYWVDRTLSANGPESGGRQNWGWAYQILPYIEQTNVWQLPKSADVFRKSIAMYYCPSRRKPMIVYTNFRAFESPGRMMMDYAGNAGTDRTGEVRGMMGNGKNGVVVRRPDGTPSRSAPVSLGDQATISDGLSTTVMLSEKRLNLGLLGISQTDDDSGWCDGWDWDHIRWAWVPPAPDYSNPDPARAHAAIIATNHTSFGSSHPGIFQTVMCDGSVRTLRYTIDFVQFQQLCVRNDGNTVAVPN